MTAREAEARPSLLIFSDDWGRHPSSCQHLAGELKDRHRIWWVNTIGTRRPRLDRSTALRALEKARQWSRPPVPADPLENPVVLNPRMWPYFRSGLDRRINRILLGRQLRPVVAAAPSPVVAIVTVPIAADLIGVLPVDRWVYYCVDDYEEWPGLDKPALRAMEARLVRCADSVVAVSESLRRKLAGMGRSAEILTHGTDLEHWAAVGVGVGDAPAARFDGLQRPLVVFWGVVDRRMDVEMLERLGRDLEGGTIVLVGPEADPDPALGRVARLARVGPAPYEELPSLAREASVLVMPYSDLPVTQAMQPLKLKEYLATGKPVVASDLPASRCWADALDLVDSPEAFSRSVRRRLVGPLPPGQAAARARLKSEGWADKASQFERMALRASTVQSADQWHG